MIYSIFGFIIAALYYKLPKVRCPKCGKEIRDKPIFGTIHYC